ncbi:mobile mystery protein A [Thalassospira sp.]|uniref:mobile mystery protein A n=1 Tax=Thalassospira sp. TaxID=1912094 RepID=UPI0027359A28|nr:mobile mystery protein A [Thalassospira sp.]MDP2697486.1 mobile mystery protein A [Thalassospira sp.]
MPQATLARKNLDKRFADLARVEMTRPSKGWIRAIRDALGISATQFARRLGVKQPRISALEKAEISGAVSIQTLRAAAEALGCKFVYAILPETSLEDLVRVQAAKRAEQELRRIHHTMTLENQSLNSSDIADERQRLINELLNGSMRRLWEDP